MNTIRALCSHCGHEMQLPATLAGKQGKCPACDQLIKLPMLGRSDSLNLAVSTGVALYESIRKNPK